jgi:hypothetical protein
MNWTTWEILGTVMAVAFVAVVLWMIWLEVRDRRR